MVSRELKNWVIMKRTEESWIEAGRKKDNGDTKTVLDGLCSGRLEKDWDTKVVARGRESLKKVLGEL
jgi:hypothetical protein